ncbi:MAG: hypothetical protein ABW252_25400 [Polyangiales bacterium]
MDDDRSHGTHRSDGLRGRPVHPPQIDDEEREVPRASLPDDEPSASEGHSVDADQDASPSLPAPAEVTLAQYREGKILPLRQALSIGQLVSEALRTLHEQGRVHGNVCEANILIAADGSVRLRPDPHGRTARNIATEFWLTGVMGRSADVYALGCVLTELTTGVSPFEGPMAADFGEQHVKSDPYVSEVLPKQTRALLLGMMHKQPEQRPRARLVADRLRELATVLPDTIRRFTWPDEALPYPVAVEARAWRNASGRDRIEAAFALAETIARFLGAALLARLASRRCCDVTDAALFGVLFGTGNKPSRRASTLQTPGFGRWVALCRKVASDLAKQNALGGQGTLEKLACKTFRSKLFATLWNISDVRARAYHPAGSKFTDRQVSAFLAETDPSCETVIEMFVDAWQDHQLVVVADNRTRDDGVELMLLKAQGSNPQFSTLKPPVRVERVLNVGNVVMLGPRGRCAVVLRPWLAFAGCEECPEPVLFMFCAITGELTVRYSDRLRHFLDKAPCDASGAPRRLDAMLKQRGALTLRVEPAMAPDDWERLTHLK